MFYLVYGKSRNKSAEKAFGLIKGLMQKKPDASFVKIDAENWNEEILRELSGTQGLFENKHIVLSDNLWSEGLVSEEEIETIKDTENIFIVLENNLSAPLQKSLEKNAAGVSKIIDSEKSASFNIFSLTDAFAERDNKKLWILYRTAIKNNVAIEDIHNILFWQTKNIYLAKKDLLNGKLKINPFVARKAKSYSANWTIDELNKGAEDLTLIYHKARLGQLDFENALEKFILEIRT
jgi:DNA polymerase III delta subunit